MLMNGKEVEHLVINGEAFDKNYYLRKIRFIKSFASYDGRVNEKGVVMYHDQGGLAIEPGKEGFVYLKYKNGYCVSLSKGERGFWVIGEWIEFID